MKKIPLNLSEYAEEAFKMLENGGLLVSSIGKNNKANVMTIGWWLLGRSYHDHPVSVIAIRPATYTFKLLEEVPEYVISVPTPELRESLDSHL